MKNIAKSICEKHLISVFGKYKELQTNDIVYRYMRKGKMKGQAFIEFESMYYWIIKYLYFIYKILYYNIRKIKVTVVSKENRVPIVKIQLDNKTIDQVQAIYIFREYINEWQ